MREELDEKRGWGHYIGRNEGGLVLESNSNDIPNP